MASSDESRKRRTRAKGHGTHSAGLLMYRRARGRLEVLLAHPGGPFFARKDTGAWTIPKGLVEHGEDPLEAARREFAEETALTVPQDGFVSLGDVTQAGGKRVSAWAFAGDCDATACRSNTFQMRWPPGGPLRAFPEVDEVAWFDLGAARTQLNPAQVAFLERLADALR